jgi:hypothetical protein
MSGMNSSKDHFRLVKALGLISVIACVVRRMRFPSAGSWAAYCVPTFPLPPGLCSTMMMRPSLLAMCSAISLA